MRISDDLRDRPPSAEQHDTRNVLLIVSAAMALVVLNATGLNVALPAIGDALGLEPGPLGWVQTIYLLVYGVAIPLFGAFADAYGARRFFVGGLAVYAVGSLLCALAPSGQLLLAARVIQAAGGAAVSGLGFALISTAVPPERRGFAFGVVGTSLGAAGIAGPLLAGITADSLGWPAVFAIGALAGLLVPWSWKLLPHDLGRGGERPDLWGGMCLALAVAGALYAGTEGAQAGPASTGVGVAVLIAVGGLVGLVVRQRTVSTPFIPRDLVENRAYLTLAGTSLLTVSVVSGVYVGLPLLLTAVNDLPLTEIGLVLMPGALLSMLLGVPIGRLIDRTGTAAPVRFGLLTILAALLGLSTDAGASIWVLASLICLLELGSTLVLTALTTAISLVVRPERLPSAQSMNAMLLSLGGSLGTTLTMGVLAARGTAVAGLNPIHTGPGVAFSDSLLLLAVLPVMALAMSATVLRTGSGPHTGDQPATSSVGNAARWPVGD